MLYTVEDKLINAHYPRIPGTTLLEGDQRKLKVVYTKYTTTSPKIGDKIRVNLVFSHATGMNKSFWKYHIDKLYEKNQGKSSWYLGTVIAIDNIGHGESALANMGLLGWTNGWGDGGKDIIKVVKNEIETCGDMLNDCNNKTIAIGHSFGGSQTLMAGIYEPQLFDTIMPIEAPYFHHIKFLDRFVGLFKKIGGLIIDEFDSLEDFKTYYKQMSFYSTMREDVLDEFINNEYYEVFDPSTGVTKFRSKCSKKNQMASYLSSLLNVKKSFEMFKLIECKIAFVFGENATWNPPESNAYFRDHANKDALIDYHVMKDAAHLCVGEKPDDLVEYITQIIDKRAAAAIDNRDYYPEVKYHGDRKQILDNQFQLMLEGKAWEAIDFSRNKDLPKL